ncbi:hypothetical protein BC829DRAFT_302193 [Chytridium lagenaria]|nr:hypothetical protein BC829DRAFT_302193 [Chytridium lagenaria]
MTLIAVVMGVPHSLLNYFTHLEEDGPRKINAVRLNVHSERGRHRTKCIHHRRPHRHLDAVVRIQRQQQGYLVGIITGNGTYLVKSTSATPPTYSWTKPSSWPPDVTASQPNASRSFSELPRSIARSNGKGTGQHHEHNKEWLSKDDGSQQVELGQSSTHSSDGNVSIFGTS